MGELTEGEPRVVNMVANGRVNPKRRVAKAHSAAETTIKGRRLPKRDFELSASMPRQRQVKAARSSDGETDLSWAARRGPRVVPRERRLP